MNPQVIVISGGSRGLGQAFVQRLLDQGHSVATFSRSSTPFVERLARDTGLSNRFYYQPCDAADGTAVHGFVRLVHKQFGRIDALINNAAIARDGVLALSSDDQISQMLDVNLKGALLLTKECSRLMLLARQGNIINVSSIIGERGFSGLSTYAATKAGILGMTRALARELGPRNIRCNAIAPGYLETEMSHGLDGNQQAQIIRRTPLGRLGTVDDVVPWIEFLLSPQSAFVTGQVITVDGGATV